MTINIVSKNAYRVVKLSILIRCTCNPPPPYYTLTLNKLHKSNDLCVCKENSQRFPPFPFTPHHPFPPSKCVSFQIVCAATYIAVRDNSTHVVYIQFNDVTSILQLHYVVREHMCVYMFSESRSTATLTLLQTTRIHLGSNQRQRDYITTTKIAAAERRKKRRSLH